jgi:hypothetical protein
MSHLLVELSFKVHRGLTAERAVEPRPVAKDFNPFKETEGWHVFKIKLWGLPVNF